LKINDKKMVIEDADTTCTKSPLHFMYHPSGLGWGIMIKPLLLVYY